MFNKVLRVTFSLLIVFLLSGIKTFQAQAQQVIPDSFTFNQIGESESQLHGPFDARTIVFGLPADWKPSGDAQLELNMAVIFNAPTDNSVSGGGTLTVTFNRAIVAILQLNQLGEIIQNIKIPVTALVPIRADGRMELGFSLNTGVDCNVINQNLYLVIHNTSRLTIPHTLVTPDVNLTKFPRPLYQDSFFIDNALVVIPDQPTSQELQSAMTVAAGISNLTGHKLDMVLTSSSQLSADQKATENIIFVGKSTALSLLAELKLPLGIANGSFQLASDSKDDGVIAMVNSPWSQSKVAFVISGNTDAGVIKAAQAVTTGVLQPNSSPNLAIVKNVQPQTTQTSVSMDETLADLGYDIVKLSRIGANTASYTFTIPSGQTVTADAFFDLVLRHTALLDFTRSGLVVSLNGQPIGSSAFTADTGTLDSDHYKVMLPPSLILSGKNQLDVSVDLRPVFNCNTPNFDGLYAVVWPESSLHLPLQPSHIELAPSFSLDMFPVPFTLDSSLSNLAFVFPHNNLVAWNAGLQLASFLGDRANGALIVPHSYYADAISKEDLAKYNFVLIGQPSQLPIIDSLGNSLPMPVQAGTDLIQQSKMQVLFSISSKVPMGYLELLPSPWSQGSNILAVLGNTSQGIIWAGNSLADPTLRSRLSGNFAAITDQQIITADTRLSVLPNLVTSDGTNLIVTGTPGVPLVDSPGNISIAKRPQWVLIASIGTAGLAILILVIAVLRGWVNGREKNIKPEREG